MNSVIDNYINGNLTEAKRLAKRFSLPKLVNGLLDRNFSLQAAGCIANYLKGHGSFQAAADSEFNSKA